MSAQTVKIISDPSVNLLGDNLLISKEDEVALFISGQCSLLKKLSGSARKRIIKLILHLLNLHKEVYYVVLLGYSLSFVTKHVIAKFVNGRHKIFAIKSGSVDVSGNELTQIMYYRDESYRAKFGVPVQGYYEVTAEQAELLQRRGTLQNLQNRVTGALSAKLQSEADIKYLKPLPFPDGKKEYLERD